MSLYQPFSWYNYGFRLYLTQGRKEGPWKIQKGEIRGKKREKDNFGNYFI
jgi:hypothetical protein